MNSQQNTWLSKDGSRQINFFLSSQDVIVIERNRIINIILDILAHYYRDVSGLKLLDLGCGDGIMTEAVSSIYPDNDFILLDGSREMLHKAKQKLKGGKYKFLCHTFEEIITSTVQLPQVDFIMSSLAIHHLNQEQKLIFFKKIFDRLTSHSMILIYDVVRPISEKSEEIQFEMWKRWMDEKLTLIENGNDVGKYDSLPVRYKNAEENKPSTLSENLDGLVRAGFHDVDCYYKYSIYSLFGGIKRI